MSQSPVIRAFSGNRSLLLLLRTEWSCHPLRLQRRRGEKETVRARASEAWRRASWLCVCRHPEDLHLFSGSLLQKCPTTDLEQRSIASHTSYGWWHPPCKARGQSLPWKSVLAHFLELVESGQVFLNRLIEEQNFSDCHSEPIKPKSCILFLVGKIARNLVKLPIKRWPSDFRVCVCMHTHTHTHTHSPFPWRVIDECVSDSFKSSYSIVSLHAKSLQSWPALCDFMDCSLPGSSVRGILQARILEWIAMPSSRGSSPPRAQTHVS